MEQPKYNGKQQRKVFNGQPCDSVLEAKWLAVLTWNGLSVDRQPEQFDFLQLMPLEIRSLISLQGTRALRSRYTPDLYVHEWNAYIEIKPTIEMAVAAMCDFEWVAAGLAHVKSDATLFMFIGPPGAALHLQWSFASKSSTPYDELLHKLETLNKRDPYYVLSQWSMLHEWSDRGWEFGFQRRLVLLNICDECGLIRPFGDLVDKSWGFMSQVHAKCPDPACHAIRHNIAEVHPRLSGLYRRANSHQFDDMLGQPQAVRRP